MTDAGSDRGGALRFHDGDAGAVRGPPALADALSGATLDPTRPLVWRRAVPRGTEFELRQGNAVFGEMEAALDSGADATGECLGHALDFRLDIGFVRPIEVHTRRPPEGSVGPHFRGRFYGWGIVTLPSGERLRWRHGFKGLYDQILLDPEGRVLLLLRPSFFRIARTQTRVIPSALGWSRPDLPELLLVTWFLRVHSETVGRVYRRRSRGRS